MLEHKSGVEHRRKEQRLGAMLGIVGIDARDVAQIQNAAGGGAVQGTEETDNAINGQDGTKMQGGNKDQSLCRFDEYCLTM